MLPIPFEALPLVSCLKSLPNTELIHVYPHFSYIFKDPDDYFPLEASNDVFFDIIDDDTRRTCIEVEIINDNLLEGIEFFRVEVVPDPFVIDFPSNVRLDPDVTFVEILDDDCKYLYMHHMQTLWYHYNNWAGKKYGPIQFGNL